MDSIPVSQCAQPRGEVWRGLLSFACVHANVPRRVQYGTALQDDACQCARERAPRPVLDLMGKGI